MREQLVYAGCDAGQPTKITTFLNVAELVEYAKANGRRSNTAWAELDRDDAMRLALNGDASYVPGALDLLAEVDAALPPTTGSAVVRSPYGGRVDMSDWMNGSPTPMRRRAARHVDHGVVKIYVSFGPSASLGSSVLIPRGNAIMALIMKIQQYRPVELYLYDETQLKQSGIANYILIGVDCRPLSLAHVGFAVSHPAFFRHVGFAAEEQTGAEAALWTRDIHMTGYTTRRDQRLSVNPEDVILSSACDWNPLINQPVEWIKAEMKRIGIEEAS